MWPKSYEQDITAARDRVQAIASERLNTRWGAVEYSTSGSGQSVLMSHGVFGGHAEGLGMVRTYFGVDTFAIAPSRLGYFGSDLPRNSNPAIQADVYAALLDGLGVDRTVVIGFSAGGPSTIELALRHPDRVELLVLASSALPRRAMPALVRRFGPPLMRAALRTDRLFWTIKRVMPRAFRKLLGVPPDYELTPSEEATLGEIGSSVFPIQPRRDGAVFDTFIGNPYVNECPLEEITVPTLIVHAADDTLAPYQTAQNAAARIPRARFVTIERGGHEFLGHEADVRRAIHDDLETLHAGRLATV